MTAHLPTSELMSRPAGQSFGAATLLERLPEPFYKDEFVTIYCADCLTLLPMIVANVVLTSPPYNQYPTFHEIQGFLNKCNNSVDPEHKGMRTTLSVEQIYEVHEH